MTSKDLLPIHLEFVLAQEEFMESQRIFCSRLGSRWIRFNYKAMIPLGIVLMIEAVALFFLGVNRPLQIIIAILGLYFVLNKFVLWPRKIAREFRKYPENDSLRVVDLGEDGLSTRTPFGSGTMLWARFASFTETERSFNLFAQPRFMYTIPKRAVPPATLGFLRSLLSQKIAKMQ